MTATYRPRTGRIVTLALAAAVAVAVTAFTGPAGQAAVIIKPRPAPLSGYHLVDVLSGATIAGPAWNAPASEPNGCPPDPAQISLTKAGAAEMRTSGAAGNCAEAESPHPYPTTAGYVYEVSLYDSSFKDWGGFWSYGDNWPAGGELDAVESTQGQSYVTYHYSASDAVSTDPWEHALAPVGKNITTGWHIVDVAYFNKKIEVFYDGHLYVTIAGSYVSDSPAWIVFGDGSCQSATYSVCASAADIGVAGAFQVKWVRIFRQ
jgi:hypothetical protein